MPAKLKKVRVEAMTGNWRRIIEVGQCECNYVLHVYMYEYACMHFCVCLWVCVWHLRSTAARRLDLTKVCIVYGEFCVLCACT